MSSGNRPHRLRRASSVLVLFGVSWQLILSVPPPAGARLEAPIREPACGPAWSAAATPSVSDTNFLYGIDGVTAADVWAVGDWVDEDDRVRTLVIHWNGSDWSIAQSPNAGTGDNSLSAVSAVSSSSAWAVGSYLNGSDIARTLIERWNGATWTVVATPNTGADDNRLAAVSALNTTTGWAVGHYRHAGSSTDKTLILRWNGIAWTVVSSPNVGTGSNYLTGVVARSATDAWAVGHYQDPSTADFKTLTLRWNGTTWNVVASPNPSPSGDNLLEGVTTFGSSGAWAVGGREGAGAQSTVILRWNGFSWMTSPTPDPGATSNSLLGVASLADGDATAVGTYSGAGIRQPLAEHWDGGGWKAVSTPLVGSPNSAFANNALESVTAIGNELWAAGYLFVDEEGIFTLVERLCPVRVLDAGFSPTSSTLDQGSTVHWSIPASNSQDHAVDDDSGMDLFSSGALGPGTSFTFHFIAGGSYPVIDSISGRKATIKIRLRADPPSGGVGTMFTVTWASGPPALGFVFDVQIKRPGSTQWTNWKTDRTNLSASFKPDAGPGTYQFRSRMERAANGEASGWSPADTIEVD